MGGGTGAESSIEQRSILTGGVMDKYTAKQHHAYKVARDRNRAAFCHNAITGEAVTTWSATHKPDYSGYHEKIGVREDEIGPKVSG